MSNPVPSDSIADGKMNFESLDEFVNAGESQLVITTRTGKQISSISGIVGEVESRRDTAIGTIDGYVAQVESSRSGAINTINQAEADVQQELQDAITRTGYNFIGEFTDGGTLESRVDALRFDGEWYRWDGALPKVVPPASTPSAEGGVGTGAWLSVGDAALRSDLSNTGAENGAALVAVDHKNARELLLQPNSTQSNFEKIATLARTGKLRMAVLGDSTAAGIGATNASAYGECNSDYASGYALFWAYNLIKSDPNFEQPSPSSLFYKRNSSLDVTALPCAFPVYHLVFSESPSTDPQRVKINNGSKVTDKLTVYHNIRTANAAAKFNVVIRSASGSIISTETIDTYVPAVDFDGAAVVNVSSHLAKTTVTLPGTYREVTVEINNVAIEDRGEGTPSNGSALCYGFTLGEGVDVRNFAVSSTTLKNESAANITRGVSTSERLQKAFNMDANAFVINWGTNDSRIEGWTTEDFKSELRSRIQQIREHLPDCAIILATTASGLESSVYENNPAYLQVLREVAETDNCGLLDGERILAQFGRDDVVADDVHPNEVGYYALSSSLSYLCGADNYVIDNPDHESMTNTAKFGGTTISPDFTGDWVLVSDLFIGKAQTPSKLLVDFTASLFRSGADIDQLEVAVDFSASAGGTQPSAATAGQFLRASYPRVPAGSGDTWAVLSLSNVLESSVFFTSGPYYLKVYMKNFGLRGRDDACELNWKFEEIV